MSETKQSSPSRESQWIGLLVLGFGALCLGAVGFFIYHSMNAAPEDIAGGQAVQQTAQVQVQQQKQQQASAAKDADRRSELSKSLDGIKSRSAKEPNSAAADMEVSESQISGAWETILKQNMTGIMDLSNGRYRLILANDNPAVYRFFSNGTYEVDGKNILILRPDPNSSAPQDGFRYRPVYREPMSVKMERRGEYMIWTRPPSTYYNVINPSSHPLLRLADDNLMIWQAF